MLYELTDDQAEEIRNIIKADIYKYVGTIWEKNMSSRLNQIIDQLNKPAKITTSFTISTDVSKLDG